MSTRVTHLLLDFDNTVTTSDTLHLIAATAYEHHSHSRSVLSSPPLLATPDFPSWKEFGEAYLTDFSVHTSAFGPRDDLQRELDYLASLKEVEQASARRVERSGLFRGVTETDIRAQAERVEVRHPESLAPLLKNAISRNVNVAIVSVTWSGVLVHEVLRRLIGDDGVLKIDICANNVLLDSEGRGTGRLTKEDGSGIATGADKLRVLKELTSRESHSSASKVVVYVGDSSTDLPPLLEADLGVVIGNDNSLRETCASVGVMVHRGVPKGWSGKERARQVLYEIEDWTALDRFVHALPLY